MPKITSRRIFFWTLVPLFFIITTLLVSYSLGYRFSFERGIFVYAGSITVKSNPREVEITLDGKPPGKRANYLNNSFHIDGIRPGEYFLEVKAPDYQSWSKKISVHSGISTEFWNVLLAKQAYEKEKLNAKNIESFFVSPKNEHIAYNSYEENELTINILDLESNKPKRIFSSPEYVFTGDEKENIEWSPKEEQIIIPAIKKGGFKHYFIVDADSTETLNLKDIAEASEIDNVRWDPERKNVIYYISQNNLYQLNIKNPQEKKILAENIYSYDLSSDKVYYFQLPSGIIYKKSLISDSDPEQITTSPPADMSDDRYKIIAYDDKRLSLINYNNGKLFVYNYGDRDSYFKELSDQVSGLQYSDDGKKLLFWNDREIFVYFNRDWDVQPTRKENDLICVTRFSQKIDNVHWAKNYEHIIFSVDKKIKVAELDHRDYRNIMDITELNTGENKTNIVSNFPDNTLYFTDENEEGSLNLYFIKFPEKTGILGIR